MDKNKQYKIKNKIGGDILGENCSLVIFKASN